MIATQIPDMQNLADLSSMSPTEYTGNPLEKKLGIKEGMMLRFIDPPSHFFDLIQQWPDNLEESDRAADLKDYIHVFSKEHDGLESLITELKKEMKDTGCIWVSWPKQASGVPTTLSSNLVRQAGLHAGLVDVKVCSIDQTWSAIKFVIRVKDRKQKKKGK